MPTLPFHVTIFVAQTERPVATKPPFLKKHDCPGVVARPGRVSAHMFLPEPSLCLASPVTYPVTVLSLAMLVQNWGSHAWGKVSTQWHSGHCDPVGRPTSLLCLPPLQMPGLQVTLSAELVPAGVAPVLLDKSVETSWPGIWEQSWCILPWAQIPGCVVLSQDTQSVPLR